MATYIAFIAALNLCIGYAMGVYIGILPGLPPRGRDQLDDDEPFTLTTVVPAPNSNDIAPEEKLIAADEHQAVPAGRAKVDAQQADLAHIAKRLTGFRSKLDALIVRLDANSDDRDAIVQCGAELKQVNVDYLQQASADLELLTANDGAEATSENQQLRSSLSLQAAEIRSTNTQIDEILAEVDPQQMREQLFAAAEQLAKAARGIEQEFPVAGRSFEQVEELLNTISSYLAEETPTAPLQVAALCLSQSPPEEQADRLVDGLLRIVAGELGEGQTAAIDAEGRVLMMLAGDDQAAAIQRCERVRQQVALTTFLSGGEHLQATVQCGLADTDSVSESKDVLKRLDESLVAARTAGESQTFHHNGKRAAPAGAAKFDLSPMEMPI